jgi:hypothetical protein
MARLAFAVAVPVLLVAAAVLALRSSERAPPTIPPKPTLLSFDALLEQIHQAAAADDGPTPDYPAIEATLATLLDQVTKSTSREGFGLPVNWAKSLRRKDLEELGSGEELCITKGGSVNHARKTVFLVDGNLRINGANDCVVVARGAVEIAHGRNNIVLAGHYIDVAHDGGAEKRGSLLVSGSILDVTHSNASVCSAPRLVSIKIGTESTFVNSPNLEISLDKNCSKLSGVVLPLTPVEKRDPLQDKLRVTEIVPPDDDDRGAFVRLKVDGKELVVRPGDEKVWDEEGNEIAALTGWKLSYVGESYALFSNGRKDAGFYLKKKWD